LASQKSQDRAVAARKGGEQPFAEMVALRAEGKPLRAIAAAMASGHKISHEGVVGVSRGS